VYNFWLFIVFGGKVEKRRENKGEFGERKDRETGWCNDIENGNIKWKRCGVN
jgi:hypothetical protein